MFRKLTALAALLSLSAFLAAQQESKPLDKPLEKATNNKTDKKTEAKPAEAKKTIAKKTEEPDLVIVRTQLPRGWKSLALSERQKKQIYAARAKFAAKKQALLDQIEQLKEEEMETLNKLLTPAQRQQLQNVKK